MVVEYFAEALAQSDQVQVDQSWLDVIPSIVSEQENEALQQVPTEEEVKKVIFQMNGESSLGPDGFTGSFFTSCWEIVKGDVCRAVWDFFAGAQLPWGYTSTLLALIPKISGKKVRGSNVALKLDMVKAYDQVSWCFLIQVMRKFGFGERWIDMIWLLISSCHFSVLLNGKPYGFFRSSRGLHQGDPLSPALFIIAAEVLSRGLNTLVGDRQFSPYFVARGYPPLTHLAYTDDIIIFCNGSKRSLACVMEVLGKYQRISGQLVNASKSYFLVDRMVSLIRCRVIARTTGFSFKELPVTYLGCPLYAGRRVRSLFNGLLDKVSQRLNSWRGRWLSMSARAILIKHVLSSIPIHILAVLVPPKGVIAELEWVLAQFFWGESEFGFKWHWSAWKILCHPVEEGGVGFRSLQAIIEVFSCKFWWLFRCGLSLWAQFIRARYVGELHPNQVFISPKFSPSGKRMFGVQFSMEMWLKWDLSRGDVAFWWDNWSGLGPLAWRFPDLASNTWVYDFLHEGQWDHLALAAFPSEVTESTADSFFCFGKVPDGLVWTLQPSGEFSTKSAYQVVRSSGVRSWAFASIWHSLIPQKFSFLMWRLLHEQLPVDDVLAKFQSLGIATPSVACVRSQCYKWWLLSVKGRAFRWLSPVLPLLIVWFLWWARNMARFEGRSISVGQVRGWIIHELRLLIQVYFPTMTRVPLQWVEILDSLSGLRRSLVSTLVRWVCPLDGFFKLNSDGCSTLRGEGSGGVIRDSCRRLILAFADFFGPLFTGEGRGLVAICPVVRAIRNAVPEYHQFRHYYREGMLWLTHWLPTRESIIDIFYEKHLGHLIDVITSSCPPDSIAQAVSKSGRSDEESGNQISVKPEILLNICDLLCFCVLHHPYRIK
ncbi:uncharacterized protein [Coffea arabica]|uniref:Reverse transcriptase domain-containing protein n=1 Tax=Coffea arabica TaxID=13443 RepID=A0A6P6TWZ0_COFAR|nr:uncharacterized protein LOC113704748 [Coffea arabica]